MTQLKVEDLTPEELELVLQYALETHWFINATTDEMNEKGDARPVSLVRLSAIEKKLMDGGFVFTSPV